MTRQWVTQSLDGHATRRTRSVSVKRGGVEAEGWVRKESRFCLVSTVTHTTMDRVRLRDRLSQSTLHSRVVPYRDAAVTLPVAVVGLQNAEAAAADPLRRTHRKNRSVKLYWTSQNT